MIAMTTGEEFLGILMVLLSGGLGSLIWARLNRIEDRLEYLSDRMGSLATREEVAALRSDVTHIALVVGADRPRAGEG